MHVWPLRQLLRCKKKLHRVVLAGLGWTCCVGMDAATTLLAEILVPSRTQDAWAPSEQRPHAWKEGTAHCGACSGMQVVDYAHRLLMPGGDLIIGNLADNNSKTTQGRLVCMHGAMLILQPPELSCWHVW